MTERISVIVSTYNRPDALDACLRALARQSDRGFEVVVADDGSGVETARVVTAWSRQIGVPLQHAWHADRGFRLAEIRNRALRIASGNYCIFLDGDCLARVDFVAAHRRLAEPGWFVTGNRVLLSRDFTESVLRERLSPEGWTPRDWVGHRLRGDVNRLAPLLPLPFAALRRLTAARWKGARGSNMAFWRRDLDAVDGFEAAITGWGREDSDLFIRMMRGGIRRKDGRGATAVLHLWHPDADRSRLTENDRHLATLLAGNRVHAEKGLSDIRREIEASRPPAYAGGVA